MLLSRSPRWVGAGVSNSRQRLMLSSQGARSFSINATTTTHVPRLTRYSPSSRHTFIQQNRSLSLFGWGSSTKPTPGSDSNASSIGDVEIGPSSPQLDSIRTVKALPTTSDSPALASAPSQTHLHAPNTLEPQVLENLQEKITLPHGPGSEKIAEIVSGETDISSVPERMGYLKDVCGLDFGWGPSSVMETLLEWLHVSVGLSWATSIVAVAAILRLAMIKPIIDSQIQGKKMREMQPYLTPLREKYTALMQAGNRAQAQEVGAQLREVNKSAGISYTKAFVPLLIQMPFSFGAFRVLRNAGQLPVPAFVTENWLWTTDLSFSDPYYITPAISAATIFLSFKLQQSSQNAMIGPQMMKILSTVMPIASFGFMSFQPGSVQLYFMTTGIFAFGTTAILRQQWFRDLVNLGPLPTAPVATPSTTSSTPGSAAPAQTIPKKLPANMQRLELPTKPTSAPEPVETGNTADQNRSMIDRAVDSVKGGWKGMVKSTQAEGIYNKKVADRQKQQRDATTARLNALRQMEIDREREERNKQARIK